MLNQRLQSHSQHEESTCVTHAFPKPSKQCIRSYQQPYRRHSLCGLAALYYSSECCTGLWHITLVSEIRQFVALTSDCVCSGKVQVDVAYTESLQVKTGQSSITFSILDTMNGSANLTSQGGDIAVDGLDGTASMQSNGGKIQVRPQPPLSPLPPPLSPFSPPSASFLQVNVTTLNSIVFAVHSTTHFTCLMTLIDFWLSQICTLKKLEVSCS